jgi:hypothetical protein
MTECEKNLPCITLHFTKGETEARWSDGTISTLTVESYDGKTIRMKREDSAGICAGLHGEYVGSMENGSFKGKLTWNWPGHGNLEKGSLDWKATPSLTAEPVRVNGGVAEKLEKQRAGAACDPFLKGLRATTSVRVEFTVAPDGSVMDIKELSHTGPYVYAHFDTLQKWTYNPYTINGQATSMRVTMLFECSLSGLKVTYE